MSAVSSKCFSSPSTYNPNRVGLSGHPCFTPMRHLKMAERPCDDRTAALSCAYRDLMMSRILPRTPSSSSTCHGTARGTVSNAFLKSTKQQYSLPAFPFCLDCPHPSARIWHLKNEITCTQKLRLYERAVFEHKESNPFFDCNRGAHWPSGKSTVT